MNLLNKFKMLNVKERFKISIAVITVIFLLVGSSYAYFQSLDSSPLSVPTSLATETEDTLLFEVGGDLSINADMVNFASGKGNQTSESFIKATLRANSKTHQAEDKYFIYLDVTENGFVYSTSDRKPEILLKITTPENKVMTNALEDVIYKSVQGGDGTTVSGYDITQFKGILVIADDYKISTNWREIQEWKVELIFVNLVDNQSINGGKTFDAKLRIKKEEIPYKDRCVEGTLACEIANLYTGTQGENDIYYHYELADSAEDKSYRYAGAFNGVDNYVCFGADTCSKETNPEKLYRIIGVFDRKVKLIKWDFATEEEIGTKASSTTTQKYNGNLTTISQYYWSGLKTNTSNSWISSSMNTTNLNGNFLTYLGTTWTNKIASTDWIIGGNTSNNISSKNAQTVYKNELVTPATSTKTSRKIGLMYISDYLYAATPAHWKRSASGSTSDYRVAINDNWMYMGTHGEWTITPCTDGNSSVFYLFGTGPISFRSVTDTVALRPVFYLNSNVKKIGGTGTATDPYIIS